MQAIILAGGKGRRLKPFTNAIPKPLVPIGDQPILEVVLRQLKHYGVDHVVIAVNHLARLIQSFFGDGRQLGLAITYSQEEGELGTAGPIRIIRDLEQDFLAMNGDLLTTLDYANLFKFHLENSSTATIATFRKEVTIDLGVLQMEGGKFVNYLEKPTYAYSVSMGIYALNRRCVDFVPQGEKYDMPQLMLDLHKAGEVISCYQGDYEWLDIGRVDDYEAAVEVFQRDRARYLPE